MAGLNHPADSRYGAGTLKRAEPADRTSGLAAISDRGLIRAIAVQAKRFDGLTGAGLASVNPLEQLQTAGAVLSNLPEPSGLRWGARLTGGRGLGRGFHDTSSELLHWRGAGPTRAPSHHAWTSPGANLTHLALNLSPRSSPLRKALKIVTGDLKLAHSAACRGVQRGGGVVAN